MTDYVKYQHVEKLGSAEVEDILLGTVYAFPKIDGTNAHVWQTSDGVFHYGSRNRELSLDNDNAGFMAWALEQENIKNLAAHCPSCHIFGEWLVPHSLKTYREDAWRDFYVFDISYTDSEENKRHMHYDKVKELCDIFDVNYIPPLRIIKNPSIDNIFRILDDNKYLIEDGKGSGEGIVLKNYQFVNKYGRQVWAKVVTSEFKEKHNKEMGAPITQGTKIVEESIAKEYATEALIEKVYAKICVENNGWQSKMIPQLLNTVYYDVIREHSWDMVKKFKQPIINFRLLSKFITMRIKECKKDLF